MQQPPNQEQDSLNSPDSQPPFPESNWWWTLGLLSAGVLLVLFAGPIGVTLVTERHGPNSYGWSADKAREAALTLRFLGAMCFAAGLVERVIIHFQIQKMKLTP